jgi:hypothetical protein
LNAEEFMEEYETFLSAFVTNVISEFVSFNFSNEKNRILEEIAIAA